MPCSSLPDRYREKEEGRREGGKGRRVRKLYIDITTTVDIKHQVKLGTLSEK